jgi:RNA polymerase subunit RPABC4/transcription elongation factor Spt4
MNCGYNMPNNAKFCPNCGTVANSIKFHTNKKNIYDGTIHRCPNCKKIINSFTPNCLSCGYELRDICVTNSVKDLSHKLETIENYRENEASSTSFLGKLYGTDGKLSKTDEQKINLIRSFPIPNTKEDILEFMLLASSNIDFNLYGLGDQGVITASRKAVSDAWISKMEQAYEKSQILFSDSNELSKIDAIYKKAKRKLKKKRLGLILLCSFPIIFITAIAVFLIIYTSLYPTPPHNTENTPVTTLSSTPLINDAPQHLK